MKFKDLSNVIGTNVYIEVIVIDGETDKELDGFGFYCCEYGDDDALCRKLDHLDVHTVKPNEFRGLDVILLGGDRS